MIYIAGDHHGEDLLKEVRSYLDKTNKIYKEYGFSSGKNPNARLEVFIPEVVNRVVASSKDSGILVCGTGAGVEIGANRFSGIRATLSYSAKSAEWARVYDKANVLCLAGWAIHDIDVNSILESWFESTYDGSVSRLEMFKTFDSWSGSS